jgi:hypothetical protein
VFSFFFLPPLPLFLFLLALFLITLTPSNNRNLTTHTPLLFFFVVYDEIFDLVLFIARFTAGVVRLASVENISIQIVEMIG